MSGGICRNGRKPPPSRRTRIMASVKMKAANGWNNYSVPGAEQRQEQFDYASQVTAAFAPPRDESEPNVVLAEAGTGIGKTLGYLAPASVWAEKNGGTVWISTYTKNLQQQIDRELDRLYPTKEVKDTHVAIRKGRENYLCLLNFDEAAAGASLARSPVQAVAAGLMTRWTAATRDGDLTGADFPGWLAGLIGYQHTLGLADRRGECIYSACDHYHKCFVEKSIRKSKRARIVVANHALVMIQSALSAPGEDMPDRYVFDEGHHLFDSADSAYSAHLSAMETRDLRRWILGPEGGRRSRARGLQRRAEGLAEGDMDAERALQEIIYEATCLTGEGWAKRLRDGAPSGPTENFLALVYKQVYARRKGATGRIHWRRRPGRSMRASRTKRRPSKTRCANCKSRCRSWWRRSEKNWRMMRDCWILIRGAGSTQ
jgi:ATP-dependent DNA helicase DinG